MTEILGSIDFTVLKVIGMVMSTATGLIMSWISKRSVNYRKIDKSMLLSAFLFFIYLNATAVITSFIWGIFIVLFHMIEFQQLMLSSIGMIILTVLIFWGLLLRTKKMKAMMGRARNVSRRLFWMINLISLVSVILGYIYVPFTVMEQQHFFTSIISYANWICTIWWFTLMITFVWRTAKYVYSEMKITLLDGEVIQYSCSPQMCRVHKNYIRLLKRDDEGIIIYERHINEASIKQIEYFVGTDSGTPSI